MEFKVGDKVKGVEKESPYIRFTGTIYSIWKKKDKKI